MVRYDVRDKKKKQEWEKGWCDSGDGEQKKGIMNGGVVGRL